MCLRSFSFGVANRMILENSHISPFSQDKLCDVDHNHAAESRAGNYTLTIGLYSETQQPHHKVHSESPEAFRACLTRSKGHMQSLQVNFEQKLMLQVFVLTFQPHDQARIKLKLQLFSCWITPCPFQQASHREQVTEVSCGGRFSGFCKGIVCYTNTTQE